MNTLYYLIAGGGLLLFVVLLLWISGNKPKFIPDFPIQLAPRRWTKKQLYEIAKEHNIDGRSKMSRDRLLRVTAGLRPRTRPLKEKKPKIKTKKSFKLPEGYVKPSELPWDIRDHDIEKIKDLRWSNPGVRFYHKWQDIPYSFAGGVYTIRPYTQGFGCDGTTRDNIYLQAKVYCNRRGWDLKEIYREVHHNEADDWIDNLEKVRHETIIPHKISPHLLITDLRDINSYDMASALEAKMKKEGLIRKR